MRTAVHRLLPILATLALMQFSSCGVWDSFTAYFNTYYNAQRAFTEAQDEVWAMPETKESGRNLLIPFNISPGTKTKFTSVIEKCSKLLQYHPDAGLVDDALMMIGRSYYYQNDYQKAERKFTELIDGYPESDLVLQAQVMLAFSYYKSKEVEKATMTAQQVLDLATTRGEYKVAAEAALVLGQIALDDKAYARARTFFEQVGENGDTSEKRAQALMKVGEMYALERKYVDARAAYERAYSLSTSYLGEYRARISVAQMLNKQQRFGDAEETLLALRSNSNYREFFGQIEYELGNVDRDRGDIQKAIEQYAYVDTAYARTEAAADANLALGMLYETVLFQYDSARAVYERGRGAINTAESRLQIIRRADYLSRYVVFRNDLIKLDSLRYSALHISDTVHAAGGGTRTDSTRNARADSTRNAHADSTGHLPAVAAGHALADTTGRALADTARPAHADSVRLGLADSVRLALADTARRAQADSTKPPVLQPPVPQTPALSLDTINVRLADRMDDIAGLFYATMGLPDSARFWYHRLLREYPDSRGAPRALYVLARMEGEDSSGTPLFADSLHREIIRRFPESPFAEESRRLLGLPPTVQAPDSLAQSYRRATALLQAGKNGAAIDSFRAIVRRAPASPLAPRALYAVGWVYEFQTSQMDSAGANYERLVALYPGTPYAQRVQPRVTEIQSARQAKLAAPKTDTTSAAQPKTGTISPARSKTDTTSVARLKTDTTSVARSKTDTTSVAQPKADTTSVVPPVKTPEKRPEEMDQEQVNKRRRRAAEPGAEKLDNSDRIPDDRVPR